jgi:hypothetical protein
MYPKQRRYSNESYRRFVASHACFGCQIENYSQCAHRNGGGMGTKHSDLESFPLCSTRPGTMGCHMQHDLLVGMTLEQRRELEDRYVAKMQAIAREAGRPEFAETETMGQTPGSRLD